MTSYRHLGGGVVRWRCANDHEWLGRTDTWGPYWEQCRQCTALCARCKREVAVERLFKGWKRMTACRDCRVRAHLAAPKPKRQRRAARNQGFPVAELAEDLLATILTIGRAGPELAATRLVCRRAADGVLARCREMLQGVWTADGLDPTEAVWLACAVGRPAWPPVKAERLYVVPQIDVFPVSDQAAWVGKAINLFGTYQNMRAFRARRDEFAKGGAIEYQYDDGNALEMRRLI